MTERVNEDRVVLFTDVHNFSIVARDPANDAAELIQSMYETLGDIIVGHDGEIIKYIGDAILCVFPGGSEVATVSAALEMRKALLRIKCWRRAGGDTELEVGIGSGPVQYGEFGHRSHRERDVFGETVNRVSVISHHRGVAVLRPVYDRAAEHYEMKRLPDVSVKWLSDPIESWSVVEE